MSHEIWIEVIAAAAAILGGFVTVLGQKLMERGEERGQRRLDAGRKQLLQAMLEDPRFEWRELGTLRRVIGANEEDTKRLLIEIGARGSETQDDHWGLVSRHPLAKAR
jgi:hypothetical protein